MRRSVFGFCILSAILALSGCQSGGLYISTKAGGETLLYVGFKVEMIYIPQADVPKLALLMAYVDEQESIGSRGAIFKANDVWGGAVRARMAEAASGVESKFSVLKRRTIPYVIQLGKPASIAVGEKPLGDFVFYFQRPEAAQVNADARNRFELRVVFTAESDEQCTLLVEPTMAGPPGSNIEPRVLSELTMKARMAKGQSVYIAPIQFRPNSIGSFFSANLRGIPAILLLKITL